MRNSHWLGDGLEGDAADCFDTPTLGGWASGFGAHVLVVARLRIPVYLNVFIRKTVDLGQIV